MGAETLLLLAGSVAAIVAIAAAAYKGVAEKTTGAKLSSDTKPTTFEKTAESAPELELQHVTLEEKPLPVETIQTTTNQVEESPQPIVLPLETTSFASETKTEPMLASITEAPAPFPEESSKQSPTTIPTDVSAVANISTLTDNITPALVITPPKRRRSSKRLPSSVTDGATRRRRAKPKTVVTSPTPVPQSFTGSADSSSGNVQSQQES